MNNTNDLALLYGPDNTGHYRDVFAQCPNIVNSDLVIYKVIGIRSWTIKKKDVVSDAHISHRYPNHTN